MVISEYCKKCQIKRNMANYPANASAEQIKRYQDEVQEIVKNSDGYTTPQVSEKMNALRQEIFGSVMDYTEIKKHYNQLMLDYFPYMEEKVDAAENHLKMAIQYAWLDLKRRKEAGEHVNERDYKKHKNDVFRLLQIVNTDEKVSVGGLVRESVEKFLEEIAKEQIRVEQLGIMITKEEAMELLKNIYL